VSDDARKLAPPNDEREEKLACIECVMAWLLYGDGAVCLLCGHAVFLAASLVKPDGEK
jgi:hypothetical protein